MEITDRSIAIFTDLFGNPTDFYAALEIHVYTRTEIWEKTGVFRLIPLVPESVGKIRQETKRRIEIIAPCTTIAAVELSGIPYAVFDLAGFRIFTITNVRDDILDGILEDIFEAETERYANGFDGRKLAPTETDEPGYFYLDLIALQAASPDISSKMALEDFLQNTPFMELKLRCSHIPPWLERSGLYDIKTEQKNDGNLARIQRKLCRE